MRGPWTTSTLLVLISVVLFVVAFVVAVGWWGHNWEAWATAGLVSFAASHLPWRAP